MGLADRRHAIHVDLEEMPVPSKTVVEESTIHRQHLPDDIAGRRQVQECDRGKTNPNLVGNNFVWVQDQCRPLSFSETCNALRDAYDDVEHKLQRAFKSDQPPLEKREAQLLSQLAPCNG